MGHESFLNGDLPAKHQASRLLGGLEAHASVRAKPRTERTPPDPLALGAAGLGRPGGRGSGDSGSGRDLGLRAPNSRFLSALPRGCAGSALAGVGLRPPPGPRRPEPDVSGPSRWDGGLGPSRPRVLTCAHSARGGAGGTEPHGAGARPARPWSGVCSAYSWHSVEPAFPTPILPVPSCPPEAGAVVSSRAGVPGQEPEGRFSTGRGCRRVCAMGRWAPGGCFINQVPRRLGAEPCP